MSIETRSNTQNRKRERQSNLDQSIQVAPKVRKTDTVKEKMSQPDQQNNAQFVDLSNTISQTANANRNATGAVPKIRQNEEITPEVRNLVSGEVIKVQRSIENKVRELVQKEMTETRKIIEELTHSVQHLTRGSTTRTNGGASDQGGTDSCNQTESDSFSQSRNRLGVQLRPRASSDNTTNSRHLSLPSQNGMHIA